MRLSGERIGRGLLIVSSAMPPYSDLTPAERRIWDAVSNGESVDFRDAGDQELGGAAPSAKWDIDRSVRAEVLVQLLTSDTTSQPRALRLTGARILDGLDLESATLVRALVVDACFFDEPARLDEARASRVEFKRCRIPALTARQLKTRGDLVLDELVGAHEVVLAGARIGGMLALRGAQLEHADGRVFDGDGLEVQLGADCAGLQAVGEVRLLAAHIGGVLSFVGARLANEEGAALYADGMRVDQDMFCTAGGGRRFEADGELRLLGAHIGGGLSFMGARLRNGHGPTLHADWLQVDEGMFCSENDQHRFEADGEIRLSGAHIGGQLSFTGARVSNPHGQALSAMRLDVDLDMFCRSSGGHPFEADGEVRMIGVNVGNQLSFSGASLRNARGVALDLESARVGQVLLAPNAQVDGIVDLTNAEVGLFHDAWASKVPQAPSRQYMPRLAGFRYQSLGPGSDYCAARLDWLAHAEDGYLPQGYDQLAAVFRQTGRDEDARRVAIAKQRHGRRALGRPAKVASYALDWSVGYGYRTWRAAAALMAIVLIGWGVFAWASPDHLVRLRAKDELPRFDPLVYSIDSVLPLINLGQENARAATGVAQVWYACSVFAGWLLGLGLVAYLTARLFRE